MIYQIFSANEWLYPDQVINDSCNQRISLAAARGTRVGCQILIQGLAIGANLAWSFHPSTKTASYQDNIEVFRMKDVLVNENTGPQYSTIPVGTPADYVTRLAPFRVYDALQRIDQALIVDSSTEALYVSWHIPSRITPAVYPGELHLQIDEHQIIIQVALEVFLATVPERETLAITNWFSNINAATYHGLELWSEDHWQMIRQYGEAMRRTRQTHFLVDLALVDVHDYEGTYTFDFAKIQRYIELFLSLGFSGIEAGHLASRLGWDDPAYVLSYKPEIQATSPEGYAFLAQFLPAWHQFLQINDWLELTIQHVADEPIQESASDFRILSSIVRKFMPGVKLIEAMIYPHIEGSIDIWVPTNEGFDKHQEHFEHLKQLGETIWFYTCWNPGGHYLNRFLDLALLKTRYLHWGNYKYGLQGYLHWGFNMYLDDQNPFELTCPFLAPGVHAKRVPAGDTHIVYPGSDGPLLSMRLEAMRAGVEDYELFQLLAEVNKPLADEIVQACMTSFTEVNTDTVNFEDVYRRLLEAISANCHPQDRNEVAL
ncbi:hypothetical protein GCM10008018_10300 [Paenibacillus marchantiophytorum]|uniref:Glycoside hydrolase 123 catalytic domain-containing protein n=1 Tax=Paenibacillus marchantiophytorum TaxID=1619310 RepID=A0ABQ2BS93_9BACL|nr:DUF4091 domain-containing protein [Paenibacillus marchantiophytorum]GGI45079.1 hypothetical protein GCM10008018_10300 [Paenibacillus marchantiophytorum]